MSNFCAVIGSVPGTYRLFTAPVGSESHVLEDVALRHLRQKLQRDRVRIGDHIAGKRLTRSVRIIRQHRVVDGEVVGREVACPLRAGGDGEDVRAVKQLLLRRLVVAKEEQLVVQDRSADRCAFLVPMEGGRRVGRSAGKLALLVEVLVRRQRVGAENTKHIPVKLVRARFAHQADHARSAALVRRRSVLGLHARLLHRVFGNFHRRNNRPRIIFGDPQRAAVQHVIHRSHDGAVDGVGGDIDARPSAGDAGDGLGIRRVRRSVGRRHARAQLRQVEDIAVQQRYAVDGIGGDQLPHGRVARLHQVGLRRSH